MSRSGRGPWRGTSPSPRSPAARPPRHHSPTRVADVARDRELGLQRIPGRDTSAVRVKEPRTIVEPLTVDQVNELLHNLRRYRDLGIAYLMLCGLRSQEVLNLRVSDIDLEDCWRS